MSSTPHAISFRRRVGAGSILGLVGLIFLGELIEPVDHTMTNAEQLRAALAHPAALHASALIILLAAALAPIAIATLVHPVRGRGVVLASIGGLLGMMGAAGLAIISVHMLFLLGLANETVPQATAALDHLDHTTAPIVLPFIFALPLALLLLAAALTRAGVVPSWVLGIAFAYTATEFMPSFTGSEILHHAFGLLAFGLIALRVLRSTPAELQTGTLAARTAGSPTEMASTPA